MAAQNPSTPGRRSSCADGRCKRCRSDRAFLQRKVRLDQPTTTGSLVRAVDLFCGCGGMSVGLQEAARRLGHRLEIPLALDSDSAVTAVYETNLPGAVTEVADVKTVFDGLLASSPTPAEQKAKLAAGTIDVLLGGPPCQGHSDLNNHTRRDDPKNALYLSMARAAEILQPRIVIVENVPPVQRDKTGVVKTTHDGLTRAGYEVAGRVLDLRRLGVPQRRQRFVLLASLIPEVCPAKILDGLSAGTHPDRTVRWAIEDLADLEQAAPYDTPSQATKLNQQRIDYLFEHDCYDLPNSERPECHRDGDHSYVSMYGRLRWDKPAQTITTGFGSMGQGRYVHPGRRRTITPHEAARLQSFPDWFDFGRETPRGVLAKVIGNAVPPFLMMALGAKLLPKLVAARIAQRKSA